MSLKFMGWRKRGGGGLIFRMTMRPSAMKATNTMTILCWLYKFTVQACTLRD